jgi:hypothetical protein
MSAVMKTANVMNFTPLLDHPYDRLVNALQNYGCGLPGKLPRYEKSRFRCPSHDDVNPSLVVTRLPDRALLWCFACGRRGTPEILKRLGLKLADLYAGPKDRIAVKPSIVATYDYVDLAGVLVAQKVRFAPKSFRWRRPDPSGRREWLWGLNGHSPGLYRLPELIDQHRVFVVEGEKAVDRLWDLRLAATCPPSGASRWTSAWSMDLHQLGVEEIAILPDNDQAGKQHAELVAQTTATETTIQAKVIQLPGLHQRGQDAFDWLGAHSSTELEQIVSGASYWSLEHKELARLELRRQQARDRQRKCRAKKGRHAAYVSGHAPNVSHCHAGHAVTPLNVLLTNVTKVSIQ